MESSEKQKQASRTNGALGGVKTPEGKNISSRNATTHGVLSHCTTKYDLLDIGQLYTEFAEEFGETSPSRKFLIQQLALTVLRLTRCARAETELLREALNPRITEVHGGFETGISFGHTVVISEGEPATITSEALEKFALIYERYEPKLVSRFLRIIGFLKENTPQ
jgi:hypothetical protein